MREEERAVIILVVLVLFCVGMGFMAGMAI